MSALKYWIWLAELGKTPGIGAVQLLERFASPEAAYAADEKDYDRIPNLPQSIRDGLRNKDLRPAEEILKNCERHHIRVITLQDTEYPERLRQIPNPPCVLYVKGQLPQIDEEVAIAMVGARKATPYGEVTAKRFAMELARQGAVIVSGIAQGIDSAALKGTLQVGGRVISVLGNGIDITYPASSRGLYEDIPHSGVLLSEYPPGTGTDGSHFPIRNRIISGLSLGVLVVEGLQKSGSLITANRALEQNRDVYAVPGNLDAPMSRGPNTLIQKGEAKLVLDPWDILEEYRYTYPHKIRPQLPVTDEQVGAAEKKLAPKAEKVERPEPEEKKIIIDLKETPESLTDDEAAILKALEEALCTADEIIEKTGIPAKRVLSALTMLQVRQLVAEEAGKRFRTPVIVKNTPQR